MGGFSIFGASMMLLIYNTAIATFDVTIRLASLFHNKAQQLVEGRKNSWGKLEKFASNNYDKVIWFHAASLGEFEQGRPVMEELRKNDPSAKILLTFYSPSGYEVRKNYEGADLVVYLPSDTKRNAMRFVELAKPKAAIFIKYEFWYHYLKACHDNNVVTLSVSSLFRADQPFFKSYGTLHRQMLGCFDHIFVQDSASFDLLRKLGLTEVSVSGDTRFDRVTDIALQKKDIPEVLAFKSNERLMVLGSVWPSDMEVVLPFLYKYKDKLKFIIAPHNIGDKDVQQVMNQLEGGAIRFSEISSKNLEDFRYLVIDNMGMLSSLYGYGEFAYIGGAFRKTLHNTLEAATHGVPVFFGDDETNKKFREAGKLTEVGGGFPIKNSRELTEIFETLFSDEDKRKQAGDIASNFVKSNTGATNKIANYLHSHINMQS